MELGIARYATTFQYSPRYYSPAFWSEYCFWVDERSSTTLEEEPEDTYRGLSVDERRRLQEARETRLDVERPVVAEATKYWRSKVRKQKRNVHIADAALVRLFSDMPKLNRIDLFEWSCERLIRRLGIKQELNSYICSQFIGNRVTQHLEQISRALQATNTRIEHLLLPTIDPRKFPKVPAIQHTFSNLRSLSFTMCGTGCMVWGEDGLLPALGHLIRSARHTLEKLEFSNFFDKSPSQLDPVERLLEYLWGYESDSGRDPIIFPRLKVFNLTSLFVYAPSLITFLQTQSTLQSVTFKHVSVGTEGYSWATVVATLPATCTKLHIGSCAGSSTAPQVWPVPEPTSYIFRPDLETFRPFENPIPKSTGWRTSKLFFERQIEHTLSKTLRLGESKFGRELKRQIHIRMAEQHWTKPFMDPTEAGPDQPAYDLTGLDLGFKAFLDTLTEGTIRLNFADFERI